MHKNYNLVSKWIQCHFTVVNSPGIWCWIVLDMFVPPVSTTHVHCIQASKFNSENQNRLWVNSVAEWLSFDQIDSETPLYSRPSTIQKIRTCDGITPFAQQMNGTLEPLLSDGEKSSIEAVTFSATEFVNTLRRSFTHRCVFNSIKFDLYSARTIELSQGALQSPEPGPH